MELTCKYNRLGSPPKASKACDWCMDPLCSACGYIVDGDIACNECYKMISECDHMCSGDCRRNGCNCDCGEFHKGTETAKKPEREFSQEQNAQIAALQEKCAKAGCEDTHKCTD